MNGNVNRRDDAKSPENRSGVRIYTHNILGRRANWDARRSLLIDGVRRLNPDIVMFQESISTKDYDQTVDILGSEYHITNSRYRSYPEGSGISIASRWPIISVHDLDLTIGGPPVDEFHWAAMLATIDAPSPHGPMLVVNHFPDAAAHREVERERQAVAVVKALEEQIEDPDQLVVLGGDLDADPDAASIRFLTGKQSLQGKSVCFRNAWDVVHPGERGWTFDPEDDLFRKSMGNWPYRRVDHLLVRCGSTGMPPVTITNCELVGTESVDGTWASDHFGLLVSLE